jgi:hypothetical protein
MNDAVMNPRDWNRYKYSHRDGTYMKPTLCIILIGTVLILMIAAAPVAAHAPANLVLSYDPVESELQATFTHTVADPSTHYIKKVWVEVEEASDLVGREDYTLLLEQEYASQPTTSTFTYTYPLEITPGTTIRLRGECNIGGEVRRSLLIGAEPIPGETTPPPTPSPITSPPPTTKEAAGFTFPLVGIALAAVAAILLRKA